MLRKISVLVPGSVEQMPVALLSRLAECMEIPGATRLSRTQLVTQLQPLLEEPRISVLEP